jgi:NADPH-dependent 2,4-dienoyl-CoA reductase/sulfur reductase-like enzyme
VIAAIVAHARGWKAEGAFRLGRWTWPVLIIAAGYLGLMLADVVAPTGLTSPRALFNYDWITGSVIFLIAVIGLILFLVTRPDRKLRTHLHDELEPTAAELAAAD